jgi:two-component system, NtrC family, sensor kinase
MRSREHRGFRRLAQLAQAVTASLALGEVLESVTHAAMDLVEDSSARIWAVEGNRLVLKVEAGAVGSPGEGRRTILGFGEGLTGHVASTLAPLVVGRMLSDPRTVNVDWMRRQGFVAYIGLPLGVRDRLVGVLSLYTRHAHRFTAAEIEILTSFGTQAAIAISNAQLFEETQERRQAAESLARAARTLTESLDVGTVAERIVATVQPLFKARYVVLRRRRPDGSLVVIASAGPARTFYRPGSVLTAGVGLAGRALAEGRPLWCRDLLGDPSIGLNGEALERTRRAGIRSFLVAPLVARGSATGVLAVSYDVPRDFSEAEVTLLETFADQAALALENARLYQEAQAREAFIRNVIETLGEGFVVLDEHGTVLTWNQAVSRISGRSGEEAIGRPFSEAFAGLSTSVDDSIRRLLAGEMSHFVLDAVERQGPGDARVVLNVKGSALTERDTPSGAALLIEDITERVGLARAMRQAEKMAALGTLSAGIAHEVNNPVGIMTSRIELMIEEGESLALPVEFLDDLQVLHRNARRVARIVQGLLSLSRPSHEALGPLDLNRVVQDTVLLVEAQMAAQGVRVTTALDPALPVILGDPTRVQQVVLNLLTNSREAMPDGGEIRIETGQDPAQPLHVRLRLADSGCGISPEDLAKVFDPFYTTKAHGTGLGLSVSYGIVREHRGTMDVQSTPGEGAAFVLRFPALRLEDFAKPDRPPVSGGAAGSQDGSRPLRRL